MLRKVEPVSYTHLDVYKRQDKNVPLGERIKFLAIYGSNLDEFFMVRVGSLQERANLRCV